jgi:hypothetical protein
MQVQMVRPEAPKPPRPAEKIIKQKPVVQKVVPRKIVMAQPKQVTRKVEACQMPSGANVFVNCETPSKSINATDKDFDWGSMLTSPKN